MRIKYFLLSIVFVLLACSACQSKADSAAASQTMTDFFDLLNQGDYVQAAELYGGSYEVLQGYNPGIDPTDRAALLQAGCEFNGLMCLPLLDVTLLETINFQEFIFNVTYANPDGSRFVQGPCCGETEESMLPIDTFVVQIKCDTGHTCQVLDLPPYVP